jgi:hypothetical protein
MEKMLYSLDSTKYKIIDGTGHQPDPISKSEVA